VTQTHLAGKLEQHQRLDLGGGADLDRVCNDILAVVIAAVLRAVCGYAVVVGLTEVRTSPVCTTVGNDAYWYRGLSGDLDGFKGFRLLPCGVVLLGGRTTIDA